MLASDDAPAAVEDSAIAAAELGDEAAEASAEVEATAEPESVQAEMEGAEPNEPTTERPEEKEA